MKTPVEVLAELFDSDDHNPFSHPEGAARRAIERLEAAGYTIVRKDGVQQQVAEREK